jgi:hypothetical protein
MLNIFLILQGVVLFKKLRICLFDGGTHVY